MRTAHILVLCCGIALLGSVTTSASEPDVGAAQAFVETLRREIAAVFETTAPNSHARKERLERLSERYVALGELTKRVVGRQRWMSASEEDRSAFRSNTLKDLVEVFGGDDFKPYMTGEGEITFSKKSRFTEGVYIVVGSLIPLGEHEAVEVTWEIPMGKDGRPRIVNVLAGPSVIDALKTKLTQRERRSSQTRRD